MTFSGLLSIIVTILIFVAAAYALRGLFRWFVKAPN